LRDLQEAFRLHRVQRQLMVAKWTFEPGGKWEGIEMPAILLPRHANANPKVTALGSNDQLHEHALGESG